MSADFAALPWRAPLALDWGARIKSVSDSLKSLRLDTETASAAAVELRRLAGQRLGLMEQAKLNRAAKAASALNIALPGLRPYRVAMLGNRTLDFLAADVVGSGLARGLLVDCAVADYDSAVAVALGQSVLKTGGPVDTALLMLDESAFQQTVRLLDPAAETEAVAAAAEYLTMLALKVRERFGVPVIVATLPLRPEASLSSADQSIPGTRARFLSNLNTAIAEGARRGEWVMFDLAGLAAEVGTQAWFDPVRFHQGKLPFALEITRIVADRFCALLAAMAGKAGRALVLDLDNTLWGGVIGDDGLEGIRIGQGSPEGEAFLAVQQMALDLRARGVVLAVCSKNNEDVAKRPFLDHPDMLLRLDHIAVFQANWQDKASNVKSIANSLNLGLDSLVFVDDNPAERERVRQELPTVQVPEMGIDAAYFPRLVINSGVFEHLVLNVDDLKRAETYSRRAIEAADRASIGNYEEYLRSLEMQMVIAPFNALGRPRIAQLISKSNQFNLTTRRYNEVQLEALENDANVLGWQIRLADKFGDHGMISVVIVRKEPRMWTIDTWLMSCRVLERGVEQAVMQKLIELARAAGVERVRGVYIPTDRNQLVEQFFQKFGFREEAGAVGQERWFEMPVREFEVCATSIALKLAP